jgi:hypothetical protein
LPCDAGVPEWPNGWDLRSHGLVPSKVRILSPAYKTFQKSLSKPGLKQDLRLFKKVTEIKNFRNFTFNKDEVFQNQDFNKT